MFTWIRLFWVVMCVREAVGSQVRPDTVTTCEEFEVGAYFNPYEVVDSMWKIFYFWGNNTEMYPVIFSLPAKQRMDKIIAVVETVDPGLEIEWHKAVLLMEPRPGLMIIFLYAGSPGAFRALVKMERRTKVQPYPLPLIKFADVRMKQVGPYIGMMCCEDATAYALVRVEGLPKSEEQCAKEALKLGIRLPNGRSYLHVKRLADEL